jgi:hypothetical protein
MYYPLSSSILRRHARNIVPTILFIAILSFSATAQQLEFDSTFTTQKQTFNIKRYQLKGYRTVLTIATGAQNILSDTLDFTSDFLIKDFNGDDAIDLTVNFTGNTDTQSLYLLDIAHNEFRKVKNFEKYPAAEKVMNAEGFYYSYYRAGCADNYWISDLFRIDNFNTVHIASIHGNGCSIPNKIDVYAITQEKQTLTETLSYKMAEENKKGKWGFIAEYWKGNYNKFQ